MKTKKLSKKLQINKTTIATLNNKEKAGIKGGYWETQMNATCYTWYPVCYTEFHGICSAAICPVGTALPCPDTDTSPKWCDPNY